jgi:2'-5' RNA ligase
VRAAFALLVDPSIHNWMRKLAVEIDGKYKTGLDASKLPPHISLKQSFIAPDLGQVETYFDGLAKTIAPFEIALTHVGFRAFPQNDGEYGVIWLEAHETCALRDLHDRICRELAERFENTHAPTDGVGYRFHATVALGEPAQVYQKIYAEYEHMQVDLSYTAKEIALFYSDKDSGDPGSFITYKILPIG